MKIEKWYNFDRITVPSEYDIYSRGALFDLLQFLEQTLAFTKIHLNDRHWAKHQIRLVRENVIQEYYPSRKRVNSPNRISKTEHQKPLTN